MTKILDNMRQLRQCELKQCWIQKKSAGYHLVLFFHVGPESVT